MRTSQPGFRASMSALTLAGLALLAGTDRASPAGCCRYNGVSYQEGTCLCMKTPKGDRWACCRRVLNNGSWTFTDRGCHVAGVLPMTGAPGADQPESVAAPIPEAAPRSRPGRLPE